MTDLVKAQSVVGRVVTAIKIEDKEIWLDFQDGGRMVFEIKAQYNGSICREDFWVLVDNKIVHQFKIYELDANRIR